MEEWRDIEGYEGYQISSEGRVRSLDRCVVYKDGSKHFYKGKILKFSINVFGYYQIGLCKNGVRKFHRVNRLVAKAFIPNPDNLPEVNHKDEDKTNNNVDNLEWCDRKYNMNYGTAIERGSEKLRNNHKLSKKVYQYTLDNQLVKVWDSTMECQRNGYHSGHISNCCRGILKQHKGYKWSYFPL